MMRIEATKFVSSDKKFGSPKQKFGSADQTFGCLYSHPFLVGPTKNEGRSDQNFLLTQPNRFLIVPTVTSVSVVCNCTKNSYKCIHLNIS